MLCATYLDPRYQCLLTMNESHIKIAQKYLSLLYSKIIEMSSVENELNDQESNQKTSSDVGVLEAFLQKTCTIRMPAKRMIDSVIEDFWNEKRLDPTDDVMLFWNNNKTTRPELHRLAEVVFAAAPTEVSVERSFSTLDFILTKLRNSLSDSSSQRIILIKLNQDLF